MIDSSAIGLRDRLTMVHGAEPIFEDHESAFSKAVSDGLTCHPKWVPCRFFYDTTGSELFEAITELPEYYLTRCERSIFERFAESIVGCMGPSFSVVELGSGSSKKTRFLIDAAIREQGALSYVSIDISADYLAQCSHALLEDYPRLEVTAIAAEYTNGLKLLPNRDGPRLFLFLGSNIGNFEDAEAVQFLASVRGAMSTEDALLVGIDFAKDRSLIEPAYNDSQGITGSFNKNLLRRMNSELGANFEEGNFDHHAPYIESVGRVEMHLVSNCEQRIWIPALGQTVSFAKGESIHTENSRKYTKSAFAALAEESALGIDNFWTDDRGWFGLFLLRPQI